MESIQKKEIESESNLVMQKAYDAMALIDLSSHF